MLHGLAMCGHVRPCDGTTLTNRQYVQYKFALLKNSLTHSLAHCEELGVIVTSDEDAVTMLEEAEVAADPNWSAAESAK